MTVRSIDSQIIYLVRTDEEQLFRYIRFSHDDWMVFMGESLESCYDCEELEKEFQNYLLEYYWRLVYETLHKRHPQP